VDFDQHVHAVRDGRILDLLRGGVVERGHDDQDAVGAMGAGFRHLVGVEHEILAQHWQAGCRARRHHEIEMALERGRIGQHRQARRAAGLVGLGQRRRVEIGANESLGRRGLFHLGNQRIVAARKLVPDRAHKTARRRGRLGAGFDLGQRMRPLGRGDFLALVAFDLGQDIGHLWHLTDQPRETAIRCFSRLAAAPLSSDLAPIATPSFKSLARPATISAAAAFNSATSR
jgi:hypothetical protein